MVQTLWSGLICVWVGLTVFAVGDEVERTWFPVVKYQSVENIRYEGENLCWTLRFFKAREASVAALTWEVRYGRDRVFVAAETGGQPLRASRATPTGQWRTLPLCVEIPPVVRGSKTIRVVGEVHYTTWTPWRVTTQLEAVEWSSGR